jgi:ketosteroid isomerase-like protein
MSPAELARAYLHAIETRAGREVLEELLDPDLTIEVLPNRLDPRGSRRSRDEALAGMERGRALLREEHYEVHSALESQGRAALEFVWTGVLALSLGPLEAGSTLRCRSSMHVETRDGRIVAQRNYDCFDVW